MSIFLHILKWKIKNGEFGINKLAENIIGGLLGIIFGCEFKNMNVSSQNYPTIDLADEDKRIAVQITSENASRKILETVAGIKERKLYQQYDMIYIYILTRKKKYKKLKERIGAETGEEFYFPAEHILDLNDIYVRLGSCQDLDKIMQAVSYLSDHLEGPDSHQHSLASQILKAGKEEFLLMMNENRFYADTAECMQKNARAYQGISEKLFPRGFRLPANCEGYGMSEEGAFMPLGELYHEHRNRNLKTFQKLLRGLYFIYLNLTVIYTLQVISYIRYGKPPQIQYIHSIRKIHLIHPAAGQYQPYVTISTKNRYLPAQRFSDRIARTAIFIYCLVSANLIHTIQQKNIFNISIFLFLSQFFLDLVKLFFFHICITASILHCCNIPGNKICLFIMTVIPHSNLRRASV